jgi:Tfp pilus assembly protein PilN
MKHRLHGIVARRNGGYLLTTVGRNASGWRLRRVRSWQNSPVRNALLLGIGASLGMESHWRRGEVTPDDIAAENDEWLGIACVTPAMQFDTHVRALAGNVIGVVPEESYLASVPRALDPSCPESFISVRPESGYYEIGVVHDGVLRVAFRLAPARPESLAGHVARIDRYIASRATYGAPEVMYWLDSSRPPEVEGVEFRHVSPEKLGGRADDGTVLRAAGVALSALSDPALRFAGPTERSGSRHVRAALHVLTAGLFALVVAGAVAAFAADGALGAMLEARRSRYERVLSSNEDIRELREDNRELAQRILQLRQTLTRQTNWSEFLELLGTSRPDGLSFVQLGSEPVPETEGRMRIALAGWAEREADVTSFISRLQRSSILSNVSLASLQREGPNASRFKVECTLRLYASSAKN